MRTLGAGRACRSSDDVAGRGGARRTPRSCPRAGPRADGVLLRRQRARRRDTARHPGSATVGDGAGRPTVPVAEGGPRRRPAGHRGRCRRPPRRCDRSPAGHLPGVLPGGRLAAGTLRVPRLDGTTARVLDPRRCVLGHPGRGRPLGQPDRHPWRPPPGPAVAAGQCPSRHSAASARRGGQRVRHRCAARRRGGGSRAPDPTACRAGRVRFGGATRLLRRRPSLRLPGLRRRPQPRRSPRCAAWSLWTGSASDQRS